jgi:AraC-like DNA-binding protein
MYDLGIKPECFNPQVYFTFRGRYEENHVIDVHSHDFVTVIYVMSGSCTYTINGVSYRVRKGDLLVFNSGVTHGKNVGVGEEIMELHIGLGNVCFEGLPHNHLISADAAPVFHLQEYEQQFISCCSDICSEQENNLPGCELMIKVHVMKLLVHFLKTTKTDAHRSANTLSGIDSSDKAVIVNTLMKYMNENYMRQISLETISKKIYLSPAYISKVFKEETGETPINYLIKIRLSKAREMLMAGGRSVKSVARAVGYDDAYYFSKLYKKYHGVAPSKERGEKK